MVVDVITALDADFLVVIAARVDADVVVNIEAVVDPIFPVYSYARN